MRTAYTVPGLRMKYLRKSFVFHLSEIIHATRMYKDAYRQQVQGDNEELGGLLGL
jgi:hypothetical protein